MRDIGIHDTSFKLSFIHICDIIGFLIWSCELSVKSSHGIKAILLKGFFHSATYIYRVTMHHLCVHEL